MKLPQKKLISPEQVEELSRRVESRQLEEQDWQLLKAALETIKFLFFVLRETNLSIKRLKRVLFGWTTEKIQTVLGKRDTEATAGTPAKEEGKPQTTEQKKKRKGHGRNGVKEYWGAQKVSVCHQELKKGDRCPECAKGNVYEMSEPAEILWLEGKPPVQGTVYQCQRLRCSTCGKTFTAQPPEPVGIKKHDETAGSMIALLKYGNGMPLFRLQQLQLSLGIPLPASTQWEMVKQKAEALLPVYQQLQWLGAQGEVLHSDDTNMIILEHGKADRPASEEGGEAKSERAGIFTSGIVSRVEDRTIALFRTGPNHAGENMGELLSKRDGDRGPPVLMCDGLSRNVPKDFKVILANFMAHARRPYVDMAEMFPPECEFVLETLRKIYENDQTAQEQKLSTEDRMRYHQTHSGPLMDQLKIWLEEQLQKKKVEPNSSMGEAITYMLKHWEPLTLFLRVPGAPLDNNVCERALKRAILHRKNSLFYKTMNGAHVGDVLMSIISTCISIK